MRNNVKGVSMSSPIHLLRKWTLLQTALLQTACTSDFSRRRKHCCKPSPENQKCSCRKPEASTFLSAARNSFYSDRNMTEGRIKHVLYNSRSYAPEQSSQKTRLVITKENHSTGNVTPILLSKSLYSFFVQSRSVSGFSVRSGVS